MKRLIFLIISESKNLFYSPKKLFYTLGLPLLIIIFFSALFYKEVPRDLPVGYIDYDQTQTSEKLIRMLDATPSLQMKYCLEDQNKAQTLLQQQKIVGFVVIPPDFQKKIFKNTSQQVVCYTNNQFMLSASLIQKDVQTAVGTFSAGVVLKNKLQKNVQTSKAKLQIQPVRVGEHPLYNPFSNYAFYLLTAIFPLFLQMVVMMITIYVIGAEFHYNQGKHWLLRANNNPALALFSKLFPYTMLLFFVAFCMDFMLIKLIGTPINIPMTNVVLISFLLVLIYQILAILIASLTSNFRSALTLGSGFTAIAFSFGAYTFPMEGLPKSMQWMANVFPYTHFIQYFILRAVKGVSVANSWQPLACLFVFSLLLLIAYPLFVKRLKIGSYEKEN